MPHTAHSGENSLLSVLAHGCALLTSLLVSIVGPLAIMAIADNDTVKANAKESLNFQITMIIYALISLPLCLVGIGFVTLAIVAVWSIIAPIIAMVKVVNDANYAHRYGWIIHFVK